MQFTYDQWRHRINQMSKSRDKMTLMAWFDSDYYHEAYYLHGEQNHYGMYPDEWFIAPAFLVRAHAETVRFLEFIEASLDAWRIKTGHRKRGPFIG